MCTSKKVSFPSFWVSIAPCQQAHQKPPSSRATAICMPTYINGEGGRITIPTPPNQTVQTISQNSLKL